MPQIENMENLYYFPGRSGDPPLHPDLQLVQRQHLLPHDHREPGAGLQAALRDLPGLQDGRPAHLLHQPHAHQHEQAEDTQSEVMIMIIISLMLPNMNK